MKPDVPILLVLTVFANIQFAQAIDENHLCRKTVTEQDFSESRWRICRIYAPFHRFLSGEKILFRKLASRGVEFHHLKDLYFLLEHADEISESCQIKVLIAQVWAKIGNWSQALAETQPCESQIHMMTQTLKDQMIYLILQAYKQTNQTDQLISFIQNQSQSGGIQSWSAQTVLWTISLLESLKAFDLALQVLDDAIKTLSELGVDGIRLRQNLLILKSRFQRKK